jgi:hypothetical protein
MSKGLEETAMHIARMPPFYDDGEKPVRQHASSSSDREIRLAFAVLLELVHRIAQIEPGYCDAATATGRAFQAALFVAKAHQLRMTCLGTAEKIAAGIVVEQISGFVVSKPARKWTQWDERSQLRNRTSLMLLAGISSYDIAGKLGLDPSFLRRRLKNDLDEIERRFGHFCKGNKALRRKWRKPQKPVSICYNDDDYESRKAWDAAIFASIDPAFDDLTETLSSI